MLADYHIHSHFSNDSLYDMETCIQDAIALGLDEICFCEHVDYGTKFDHDDPQIDLQSIDPSLLNVNYPIYQQTLLTLKQKYQNQINIKMGLEFGVQVHTISKYNQLFEQLPLDFVLLSIHQIDDQEFWRYHFQANKSEQEYYQAYFDTLYTLVCNFHNYSVLAHLDLIKRYDDHDNYPMFLNHQAIITKILKQVIQDGKGIEVNTSSFRYGLDDLTPSMDILKLYYQLGGKIITLGSDTHKAQHLQDNHFSEVKKLLKEIGFEYYCTFEQMQPIFHRL